MQRTGMLRSGGDRDVSVSRRRVYLAMATDSEGKEGAVIKFAVIR